MSRDRAGWLRKVQAGLLTFRTPSIATVERFLLKQKFVVLGLALSTVALASSCSAVTPPGPTTSVTSQAPGADGLTSASAGAKANETASAPPPGDGTASAVAQTDGPSIASAGATAGSWDPTRHPDRTVRQYDDDALAPEYAVWEAGKAWKIRGAGYEHNAKIELEFQPTISGNDTSAEADQFQPQTVGQPLVVTADENGTVSVLVFVPLSMQAGTYSLTAYAGDVATSTPLEIVSPA